MHRCSLKFVMGRLFDKHSLGHRTCMLCINNENKKNVAKYETYCSIKLYILYIQYIIYSHRLCDHTKTKNEIIVRYRLDQDCGL